MRNVSHLSGIAALLQRSRSSAQNRRTSIKSTMLHRPMINFIDFSHTQHLHLFNGICTILLKLVIIKQFVTHAVRMFAHKTVSIVYNDYLPAV
ncbi:MAG: hypothetical protein RQ714_01445 [Nitrosomonas sp.]|nr:hypothetical protein [Nitrosomonas sp.]